MRILVKKLCRLCTQRRNIYSRYASVLIIAAAALSINYAQALPKHPYFITLGAGAGWVDWSPVVGHTSTPDPDGSSVYIGSPESAQGSGAVITTGIGLDLSSYFLIEGDFFYFTPAKVAFKADDSAAVAYKNYHRTFHSYTQAGDIAFHVSVPLLKNRLKAYVGAGVGYIWRHDVMADIKQLGGNFSAGLTHPLSEHFLADLGFSYFTGYDKSVVTPVNYYVPFLYGLHLNITYKFG